MRSDSEMVNLRSVVETLCYMVDEESDGVEEVMQLPSIDLVRCEECRYVGTDATCYLVCDREGMGLKPFHVYPDDFCSYGERREP